MPIIGLDEDQRRRAKDILQRLYNDELTEPKDIVEQWEKMPEYDELDTDDSVFDTNLQKERKYVPVSDIIGTGTGAVDCLEQERLKNVLELLVEGKFKREPERPPKLERVAGDYYVAVDGVHRSLAVKAIGLEEIYVEVIELLVE